MGPGPYAPKARCPPHGPTLAVWETKKAHHAASEPQRAAPVHLAASPLLQGCCPGAPPPDCAANKAATCPQHGVPAFVAPEHISEHGLLQSTQTPFLPAPEHMSGHFWCSGALSTGTRQILFPTLNPGRTRSRALLPAPPIGAARTPPTKAPCTAPAGVPQRDSSVAIDVQGARATKRQH